MGTTTRTSAQLPLGSTAAGVARRLVRKRCHGLPEELTDVAVLLTSEVVTDSVLRARLGPDRSGAPITLRVWRHAQFLRVEVHDRAGEPPVGPARAIVAALTAEWGRTSRPSAGTVVWFVLKAPRCTAGSLDDRHLALPPAPRDRRRTVPDRPTPPQVPRQRNSS